MSASLWDLMVFVHLNLGVRWSYVTTKVYVWDVRGLFLASHLELVIVKCEVPSVIFFAKLSPNS